MLQCWTLTNGYTYLAAPTLNNANPNSGSTSGGSSVTLTGNQLSGATSVLIGGTPAATINSVNDTTINLTTPPHVAGTFNIVVNTPGGSGTLVNGFNYVDIPTLTSIQPTTGTTAGGESVELTGTNLSFTTSVNFGATAAPSIQIIDASHVIATTPLHTAGTVGVTVNTTSGSSTLANSFTYSLAPTISAVNPVSGPLAGNITITLSGSNLTNTSQVNFGGQAASNIQIINDSTLTLTLPASLSAGPVNVTVTTPVGSVTLPNGFTYANVPTLTSVTPNSGTIAGGTNVSLSGTNLLGTSNITFAGINATGFSVINDTTVTAITPASSVAGTFDVVITTPVSNATLVAGFTYNTLPALSSLSPLSGSTAGGTQVTLTGSNLLNTNSVTFDGLSASFIVNSDTSITAVTPNHPTPGVINVSVTTPSGSSTLTGGYTFITPPLLSSVAPSIGSTAGGLAVTLTGSNLTGTTQISFGGNLVTQFNVVDSTTISALTPDHADGIVNIILTNPIGVTTLNNGFTYESAPILNNLSPVVGTTSGGTSVTLSGSHLANVTSVLFDGIMSSFIINNDTTITATTPAHASATIPVTVVNPIASTNLNAAFTYQGSPTLTSISPTVGTIAGGTLVTLTGSNLIGTTQVSFDGNLAKNINVIDANTVSVTTPAHAAGTINVVLTTPIDSTPPITFTYDSAPSLSSISPNTGPVSGNSNVTLTGTNLTLTNAVTFGGTPATSFNVVNATTVNAVTPAHASGPVNVILTTPINSATLTNAYTYLQVPNLSSCQYNSLTIYACVGINLDAFPNTFINVQGGLTCGLAVGITPLLTTVKTALQLQGVTLPLLYNGCQIKLCANATCAGIQSNSVIFGA